MKKSKILMPIITVGATVAALAPVVMLTSCSKKEIEISIDEDSDTTGKTTIAIVKAEDGSYVYEIDFNLDGRYSSVQLQNSKARMITKDGREMVEQPSFSDLNGILTVSAPMEGNTWHITIQGKELLAAYPDTAKIVLYIKGDNGAEN